MIRFLDFQSRLEVNSYSFLTSVSMKLSDHYKNLEIIWNKSAQTVEQEGSWKSGKNNNFPLWIVTNYTS